MLTSSIKKNEELEKVHREEVNEAVILEKDQKFQEDEDKIDNEDIGIERLRIFSQETLVA